MFYLVVKNLRVFCLVTDMECFVLLHMWCVVTGMECFVLLQTWSVFVFLQTQSVQSVLCCYSHRVFCVDTDMECFVLLQTWSVLCCYRHGAFCVLTDTEPPVFANCPSAVREVSYLSSAFFSEPVASDNVMVSELSVTPNDYRVSDVIQTDLQVSYVARDHAANIGSCVVNIRVKGKESLLVFSSLVLT